jgi:hypothetical protein
MANKTNSTSFWKSGEGIAASIFIAIAGVFTAGPILTIFCF